MTERPDLPRFLDAGESALVVEFGTAVDPAVSERVLALDAALGAVPVEGLRELVPTYRSLMIHYDPLLLSRDGLVALVEAHLHRPDAPRRPGTHWTIPCCYEGPHGEDVAEVADALGLGVEKAVAIHAGATYRVYMYGFAPGYTYLGGLPPELAISRRPSPRAAHASHAILIGGGLCSISTFSMPTGWYVMGRTPERPYAADRARPFLLEPGDTLRFEAIDLSTFHRLDQRAAAGETVARTGRR